MCKIFYDTQTSLLVVTQAAAGMRKEAFMDQTAKTKVIKLLIDGFEAVTAALELVLLQYESDLEDYINKEMEDSA